MKKVLVLHGYSQNGASFYKRLGSIRKHCIKDVNFVFVDAPHILQPADLDGINPNAIGAAEAALEPMSEPKPEDLPRGWWRTNAERTRYDGVAESIATLRDVLAKDRFDGVFGFSQGAAMAALIAAVLEKPELYPPFLIDGKPPHPPLTFCVAVSGFKPRDSCWEEFFSPSYQTPTLHVFGLNDVIIPPERVKTLIDVSANRRVVTHDGGHFVPAKQPFKNFLRDYLRDPLGNVPLPPASDAASAVSFSLNGTPSTTPVPSAPDSGRASPSTAIS